MKSMVFASAFTMGATISFAVGALPVSVGMMTNDNVRGSFSVVNTLNQPINDAEFRLFPKEGQQTVRGATAFGSNRFGQAEIVADTGGANFRFSGGDVNPGDRVSFDVQLSLTERNQLRIRDFTFTRDNIPVAGGFGGGFEWDDPRPGGRGGGGAGNLGGNGFGGQEGFGGSGFWLHLLTLDNFDERDFLLTELKIIASNTFYDDLANDVPWELTDPVNVGSPAIVPGGGSLSFNFETVGAYREGHIYLRALFDPISIVQPGVNAVTGQSLARVEITELLGDHPVPIPLPISALTLLCAMSTLVVFNRKRRMQ